MYNILSYDSIHSSKRLNNTQSAENYVRNTLAEVSVFTLPLSIENLGFNTVASMDWLLQSNSIGPVKQ
jgi:hypothetical protein